jgi:hypothetical protein
MVPVEPFDLLTKSTFGKCRYGFVLIALPHHGLRAAPSASKIQQSYRFTASLTL